MAERKCEECSNDLNGLQRKFCSNACKQKNHWHRVKEQQNTYHSQTIRAYNRKLKLIELSGGECQECGYKKNIAVLQFHHRDSKDKSFSLDARNLSNRNWEIILKEHKKCDLLCANCHHEHHNPEMDIDNVKMIVENHNGPIA